MGRHAHPSRRPFWASLGAAVLRASGALALVVAVFALVASIDRAPPPDGPVMLGGPGAVSERDLDGDVEGDLPPADPQSATPSAEPDAEPSDRTDAALEEATPGPDAPGPDAPDPDAPAPGAPAHGPSPDGAAADVPPPSETTVQVLDGVGGSPQLPLLVAALEELGYVVVATNPASTDHPVTAVLYSQGYEAAARALQARDPRIAEVRANDGLSEEVHLHVVLGADWQP